MAKLKKAPTQAAYNKLEKSAAARIETVTGKLTAGKITADVWYDRMLSILADKHGAAAALGRQKAGDLEARSEEDDILGEAIATEEARYLFAFTEDVKGEKYLLEDGTLDGDRIQRRAGFYPKKLLATANEALVQASDPEATFDWHLGYGLGEECEDCPTLADGGPYTAATIPTYPRSGATQCLFNCLCSLVRSDGVTGFLAPT